ncbi:hypothetical protein BDL97_10G078400 [Sphagnum fallax]|nr:hypothetical protein BDL97_10G078400 [Sphagnum fallax]
MGLTSTLVKVGSREFSTPSSYPPINTSPFRPVFCCIAFFSPLSAPLERNSKLVELCKSTSFQVSSGERGLNCFEVVFIAYTEVNQKPQQTNAMN